jgi:signal transduction histidine kinase/ligand-binding sensor domain-containing protein
LGAEDNWSLRVWRSDEGLPDNIIEGVAQTSDGFLWVATRSGLADFDGVRFQEFAPASTTGAMTSEMQKMIVDRHGRLWMAKDRRVVLCVEAGQTTAFTAKDGLPDLPVLTMDEDGQGAIWISYWNGPVVRIHEGHVTEIRPVDSPRNSSGYRLASDTRGQMWIAHANILEVFSDGHFRSEFNLPASVERLGKARSGGIWISAASKLYKCSENGSLAELSAVPGTYAPTTLFEDSVGALWIGTSASGLFRYTGTNFTHVKTSYQEIQCVTEDHEGSIWVGTRGGGLNQLRIGALSLGFGTNFLSSARERGVRSVCQDTDGNLWVVSDNDNIIRREGNRWTQFEPDSKWPQVHCLCVTADPKGGVWIGTGDNHLYLWRGQIVADYCNTNGLIGRTVRTLLATSSGDVWIGSRSPNSLQRLRAGKLQNFELPLESGTVTAMAVDGQGNFWAGTSSGILMRVNNEMQTADFPKTLAKPQPIHCLATSPDGSLWIGYGGQGVGRLKAGQFSQFSIPQGLETDNISQIVPDGRGRIWFADTANIFYVLENAFDALIEGRVSQLKSVVYGKGAGLPLLQASQGYWPGAIRTTDGRLCIPTLEGLASVNLDEIKENLKPPPVVIERVTVDGHTLAAYEADGLRDGPSSSVPVELRATGVHLRVPPSHRHVQFEFTALSFIDPANVAFKYRLEGIDDDWVDVSSPRTVSYGHLPPGQYLFQVIACNSDGVWNKTGVSLTLTSAPHIWETVWFRAVSGISVLGLSSGMAYLIMRRKHRAQIERLENQRTIDRERARIAQDLHDDLGTTLTQIDILGALASRPGISSTETIEQVGLMQTKSREMVTALDEIVWAVNPRNDSLAALTEYLCSFAEDFLTKASIRCRLDLAENLPDIALQADLRHNLFLALKEALNNAVRHSKASEVWLRLTWDGHAAIFTIQDNGIGFDPDSGTRTDRNGLRNMMERMKNIGGKYEIRSQPKSGTSVEFTILLS